MTNLQASQSERKFEQPMFFNITGYTATVQKWTKYTVFCYKVMYAYV